MLSEKDLKIIDEISNLLKSRYTDYKGIYFFGSRLTDNFTPDSDYDILLVFNRDIDYSFKREIRDLIYNFMIKYEIVIDTKIFSEHEMIYPNMPFTMEVKQNGYFHVV